MKTKFKAGDKVQFIKYDDKMSSDYFTIDAFDKDGCYNIVRIHMDRTYVVSPSKVMPIHANNGKTYYPISRSESSRRKKYYVEESYLMKVIDNPKKVVEEINKENSKNNKNENILEKTPWWMESWFVFPKMKSDKIDTNKNPSKMESETNDECDCCECELRKKYDELLRLSNEFVSVAKLLERILPI